MISELDLTKVMRLSRFSLIYMFISLFPCLAVQKGLFALVCRDDNETGFFGYPLRPAPNGTGFKFNKRVWDGYEIFFFKPGTGSSITPSHPAPFTYKINFKIKLNLKFYFTIFNIWIIIKFFNKIIYKKYNNLLFIKCIYFNVIKKFKKEKRKNKK